MITRTIRINPRDIALSRNRPAPQEIGRAAPQEKHIPGQRAMEQAAGAGGWSRRLEQAAGAGGWSRRAACPIVFAVQARLSRLQLQGCRIDAVAQARGPRSVVEDVAEMALAFRAQHLGPDHAVADVPFLVDMAL